MSLLSALTVGANALTAHQAGLTVAGNNIANANTPGYIRQELQLSAAPAQNINGIQLGTGVRTTAIVQKFDAFVYERLRTAQSDVASGDAQEKAFFQIESVLNELSENDLSSRLSSFFSSIHDVVNQPETESVRNIAVLEAKQLTAGLNRLSSSVRDIRLRINSEINGAVNDINDLISDVKQLNEQIVELEGAAANGLKAVSLRDQRNVKLDELTELVDVKSFEQEDGSVNIVAGGEFLLAQNVSRTIVAELVPSDYLNRYEIRIAETDGPLSFSSGKLEGLVVARDDITYRFEQQLNDVAAAVSHEFNRIHSQGQGLTAFSEVASSYQVDDLDAVLDSAGLPFTPESGTISIAVKNRNTGVVTTTDIAIELNGLDTDTTALSLRDSIQAIEGLEARIGGNGQLEILSTSKDFEFSFAGDTSGTLAAFGINTFFEGTTAFDIRVNDLLVEDPSKFAISQGGVGNDVENGLILAELHNQELESSGGRTIMEVYELLVSNTSQGAATTQAVAEGNRIYAATLESEHLSVSGVNLDEEALKLLSFQRSYQASARYIQTVDEVLQVLLRI